ncbi:MAG: fused MFS/spermidine synthase [Methyloversatilis sp.]|uniref:fused MFS/spermidine synthase n=1 Tax=Methyloversatilis sp. TaxID=2569862 RepID=UPI0027341187|nr:fused MFS/spermidine synthase [Methyloversatilis sp.]MDP3872201.1 fused MFS/spermidine synthase [Methyloversatilis sp.]
MSVIDSAADSAPALPPRRHTATRGVALLLMVASGFAALGYQIAWTQQAALWLGHEAAAVLAVVAAFFGGLAVGALMLGPRIDRSRRSRVWYVACELVIGLWSLALALMLDPVAEGLLQLIGPQPTPLWHWAVAFGGTFLLLLPATAAMGATLPAMEGVLAGLGRVGQSIAPLYAGNTLGALLGVLASAFWLVPSHGLTVTAAVCAALNLLCAVIAWRLFPAASTPPAAAPQTGGRATLRLLAMTGLLGIAYEVLVVRVLSQVAENTVYTFALLLAVYLVGTAIGAALYAGRRIPPERADALRDRLLVWLAWACLVGILGLSEAATFKSRLNDMLGATLAGALIAEAALACIAFLLPTVVMGALFSHLATQARTDGVAFGRALGINTLGAALAPPLFGLLLVPVVGSRVALLLLVPAYVALCSPRGWLRPGAIAALFAAIAALFWMPSLTLVDIPAGGRLASHVEGALATVSVVEDADGVATLHINNRQQEGSTATLLADGRQALLPMLLHPAPERALFLGLGTGVTASTAAQENGVQVDVAELLPEVIDASARFTEAAWGAGAAQRMRVVATDARRFVRAGGAAYDVIVADNFHPARSGSGSLYTVEHFAAIRARLAPDGVFCQWLPLHQLDLDTLRSIVRAYQAVYPQGWAMLATNSLDTPVIGLVARADDGRFDVDALRQRLQGGSFGFKPEDFGVPDALALLGSFAAGPAALANFAGAAPLNTDDHPVVIYLAPRITYQPDSLPRDRLMSFLQATRISPDELLATSSATPLDAAWAKRLDAYWQARNRFIDIGRQVQPSADVRQMLAQVGQPLLDVLAISPDFRPAYDPLLRMSLALARIDADAARSLLQALARLQPARPEAADALRALSASSPP